MSKEKHLPFALTNEQKVSVKEKQIEEMAKDLVKIQCNRKGCEDCEFHQFKCEDLEYYKKFAEALYNAGYRKQSEGEWIIDRTPIDATFKCSKCGYSYIEADPQAETEYKFCPNCGAKMKGGEE